MLLGGEIQAFAYRQSPRWRHASYWNSSSRGENIKQQTNTKKNEMKNILDPSNVVVVNQIHM